MFWNQGNVVEPKRQFRWQMLIPGKDGKGVAVWTLKSATKPEITSEPVKHKYMGHEFKFPGSTTWNDIEVKLIDPVSFADNGDRADVAGVSDNSMALMRILRNSGYKFPSEATQSNLLSTVAKRPAVNAVGVILLQQVSFDQTNAVAKVVDTWKLINPWVSKLSFGNYDYNSEEISELGLTIVYDWAYYNVGADATFSSIV